MNQENKFRRMSTQISTEKKFHQKPTNYSLETHFKRPEGRPRAHDDFDPKLRLVRQTKRQKSVRTSWGSDFRAVCFPLLLYLTKHAGPKRATAAEFLAAGPRVRKDSAREDILENTSATLGLVFGSSGGKSSAHLPELRTHSQSKVHFDILSLTSTPEFCASSAVKGFHEMRKEFSPFFLEI